MAQDSFIQETSEVLTSPLRIAPAFWYALRSAPEALSNPVAYFDSLRRILFDPDTATPNEMKEFSQWALGLEPGVASFVADTLTDPTFLMAGLGSRSMRALGFGGKVVTPAMRKAVEEGVPKQGFWGWLFPSFNTIWKNEPGFEKQFLMDGVSRNRVSSLTQPYLRRKDEIFRRHQKASGLSYDVFSERATLFADGKRSAEEVGPSVATMWAETQGLLDDLHTELRSAMVLKDGITLKDLQKTGLNGAVSSSFLHNPMGYLMDYFPHVLNRKSFMLRNAAEVNAAWKEETATWMQWLRGGMPEEGLPGGIRNNFAANRELMQRFLKQYGHLIAPGFRKERVYEAVNEQFFRDHYLVDFNTVMDHYIHAAARSKAYQMPLTWDEAMRLSGGALRDVPGARERFLDPEWLKAQNKEWLGLAKYRAKAYQELADRGYPVDMKGYNMRTLRQIAPQDTDIFDYVSAAEGRMAAIDQEITARMQAMPYEQMPLEIQMKMDGIQKFPGHNFFKPGNPFEGLPPSQMIANGRIYYDWMRNHLSPPNASEAWETQLLAGMFKKLGDTLEKPLFGGRTGAQYLNDLSPNKDAGTRLKAWFLDGGNYDTSAKRIRAIVGYTYFNALGFRPMAMLVNMTQPLMTVLPDVGVMPLVRGIWDASKDLGPIMRRYKEIQGVSGGALRRSDALRQALSETVPDMARHGLIDDTRVLEAGTPFFDDFMQSRLADTGMLGFTASELWNRLVSFRTYQGMLKERIRQNPKGLGEFFFKEFQETASREGLDKAWNRLKYQIDQQAADETVASQFIPTPGSRGPIHMSLLSTPIRRQFTNYPFGFVNKTVNWFWQGALDEKAEILSGTLKGMGYSSRGILPLARMMAAGNGLANFTEDVLGWNLGEKVVGGILPLPLEKQAVFGIIPTPPVAGAVLGAGAMAMTGDINKIGPMDVPFVGQIPVPKILMPGGVALGQAAKIFNQIRTSDLRHLYDDNGRVVEDITPTWAFLRGMGFVRESSRRDAMKVQRLVNARDGLMDYRHRYAWALARGDQNAAASVQASYRRDSRFKDAPPLNVEPDTIERYRRELRKSRLDRVIEATRPSLSRAGVWEPYADYATDPMTGSVMVK